MISRRYFLAGAFATGLGGIGIGIAGNKLRNSTPSLRFIGGRESMLVLLDAGRERVLMVLGEPNDALLENVTGIGVVGRRRIDMVMATHRTLSSRAARAHLGLEDVQVISLQTETTLPPNPGDVRVVSDLVELGLSNDVSLRLQVLPTLGKDDHPDYVVYVSNGLVSALIASSPMAANHAAFASPDVLVVQGEATRALVDRLEPELLVTTEPNRALPVPQLRIFWNDPVAVDLGNDSIRFRRDQLWS